MPFLDCSAASPVRACSRRGVRIACPLAERVRCVSTGRGPVMATLVAREMSEVGVGHARSVRALRARWRVMCTALAEEAYRWCVSVDIDHNNSIRMHVHVSCMAYVAHVWNWYG